MEISKDLQDLIEGAVSKAIQSMAVGPDGNVWFTGNKESQPLNCSKSLSEVIKTKRLAEFEVQGGYVGTMVKMAIGEKKSLTSRSRESYRPNPEQLGMINKIAKEDQSEQSGYVFPFQATNLHNRPDRRNQMFNNTALSLMANYGMGNAIPYLVSSEADCEDHTWKAINSKGYVINAYAKDGGLFYDVYVPEDSQTRPILDAMFNGRINKLSVGFGMNPADVLCSSCQTKSIYDDACPHTPGDMDENGKMVYEIISKVADNYEISAVAVPCQAEAKITRSAKSAGEDFEKSIKGISKVLAEGSNFAGSNYTINEYSLVDSPPISEVIFLGKAENLEIGKINNGKNTIEDNSPMADIENTQVADQPQAEVKAVEAPAAEVSTVEPETKAVEQTASVEMAEDTKLCKLATSIKDAAVKEINESIKSAFEPVLAELAQIKEEMEGLKKGLKKVRKELEAQAGVPGSAAFLDASRASAKEPLNSTADTLLEQPKPEAEGQPEGLLGPILRK